MKNHRFTRRPLAWLCIMVLVLSTMLSACSTEKPADNGSNTNAETAIIDENAQPTEAVQPDPEALAADYEWPEEFSLYQAYTDDFLIGTIYTDASRSGADLELTLTQFNAITPENLMKPQYMQPTEGNFNYSASDVMVKFAEDNSLNIIGHCLAWHSQSGNWLGQNVTRDVAIEQLKSHITNIAGKYKGKMTSWDVVNEAINDGMTLPADGDWTKCLRQTQWLTSIGSDYLALAFTFAHEADPDAKLYYNDYNLNNKGKADIVYAMVKDLKAQGIPIDGIGMQGHYSTDTSIGSVEQSLKSFSELGVEVSITELDVTVKEAAATGLTEEQEIKQAIEYAKLFQVFKQYKDTIARVTFWGYLDNKSWRAQQFPCLFNADYTPKQAAYAVLNPEKYLELHADNNVAAVINEVQAKYGTPVIDAEVDDAWKDCPEVMVTNQVMAWQGATGKVRLLWDESFVYALFEVKDSVLNRSSQNVYEQDSIEIFLDQNGDKLDFYGADDGQYRVNYMGAETFGTVPNKAGFTSAVKTVDGGYLVELAIPLIIAAKEGMKMGFDAQINDSNDSGMRQAISKFNDISDNSWSSTKSWGNLKLVK